MKRNLDKIIGIGSIIIGAIVGAAVLTVTGIQAANVTRYSAEANKAFERRDYAVMRENDRLYYDARREHGSYLPLMALPPLLIIGGIYEIRNANRMDDERDV
jgi:hypothetical protein